MIEQFAIQENNVFSSCYQKSKAAMVKSWLSNRCREKVFLNLIKAVNSYNRSIDYDQHESCFSGVTVYLFLFYITVVRDGKKFQFSSVLDRWRVFLMNCGVRRYLVIENDLSPGVM